MLDQNVLTAVLNDVARNRPRSGRSCDTSRRQAPCMAVADTTPGSFYRTWRWLTGCHHRDHGCASPKHLRRHPPGAGPDVGPPWGSDDLAVAPPVRSDRSAATLSTGQPDLASASSHVSPIVRNHTDHHRGPASQGLGAPPLGRRGRRLASGTRSPEAPAGTGSRSPATECSRAGTPAGAASPGVRDRHTGRASDARLPSSAGWRDARPGHSSR
jgi:hypothetical protein